MPQALVAATTGPDRFDSGVEGRCAAVLFFAVAVSTAWFSLAASTARFSFVVVFAFVAVTSTFAAVLVRKGERLPEFPAAFVCGVSTGASCPAANARAAACR